MKITRNVLLILAAVAPQMIAQNSIVISQVYGGGGNSGATLKNDFVELFNRGSAAVNIAGWSIQYASASGSSWDRTLLSGTIQPGQYYLVQEHAQGGGSVSLPTPDLSAAIDFSATDGKIALVSNSTNLSGTAPTGSQIIDFIGYGNANASEGSPSAALTNTTAAIRQSGGCTDSNNNRADFSLGSPSPRNSHSPVHLCAPAVVQPPTISSISPGVPTASGASQTITVFGSQFQAGLTVTMFMPGGGSTTLGGNQLQGLSSTSFQISVVLVAAGNYGIRVSNADGGQSSTFTFNVVASVPQPTVDSSRIALNSASFTAGAVAPGSLVSIFGTNFASANTLADSIPLPMSLADVGVTFNGVAAAISGVFHDAVNGDQINVQLPWTITAPTTAQVVVTHSGVSSSAQPVPIAAASPGIFAIQLAGGKVIGSGLGQAIAYSNSDGAIAAPVGAIDGLATHPAKINDPATLVILVTGLGAVDSTVKNGDVPPVLTANTPTKPTVTIGDVPAQVVFSGMVGRDASGKALGFVGVYQINVIVAPGTPSGDAVKLQVSMNGATSRPDVTIAVSQ